MRASESLHFWWCAAAFAMLLAAILLQVFYRRLVTRSHRIWCASLFLMAIVTVGLFNIWYETIELPRVSPDLATASIELTPWVIVGVTLLGLSLAHYVGVAAARHMANVEAPPPATIQTRRGWLTSFGAMTLAVSAILVLLGLTIYGFGEIFSNRPWDRPNHFFERGEFNRWRGLLVIPDLIPILLLLPCCVRLLAQTLRQPQLTLDLQPIRLRDYLLHFAATLAVLAVGIPCLRSFGLAMWLGPTWRLF